jgi:hypothetical protein
MWMENLVVAAHCDRCLKGGSTVYALLEKADDACQSAP